jgi:hypothetical protein
MGKQRQQSSGSIAGVIWKVGSNVATKSDVESIKTSITPVLDKHEDRICALEIQMAHYFGASQTSLKPSGLEGNEELPSIVLAQYQPQAIPSSPSANAARQQMEAPRRIVVQRKT